VREAFKRGLLTDGELWLDMIDKRNLTSHTYNAELAQDMVNNIIHLYHPSFVALQFQLQQRI
jgi:nucleotidyltransferase substrate binding protein (TIGR01987 family)